MSAATTNLQNEYLDRAFRALMPILHLLPPDTQRVVRIAESLTRFPGATTEELRKAIGPKWVIARRSKRIVERYGEDVICLSHRTFCEIERKIVAERF